MNGFIKGLMIVLAIIYAASPVDLAPGPIDDILVLALTYMLNMKRSSSESKEDFKFDPENMVHADYEVK